jgi:uncharacterized membrane protein
MRTTRGLERLIFFTDAITAIAITLLILPLVDLVPDAADHYKTAGDFLADHLGEALSFVVSFAVIARLWIGHHALFEHVRAYSSRLLALSLLWAFTIVLLPLPTALFSEYSSSFSTVSFYIGTMTVSSLCLTAMTVLVRRDPVLQSPDNPISDRTLVGSWGTTIAFIAALIVGSLFIHINFWALLLLAVTPPIEKIFVRRMALRKTT